MAYEEQAIVALIKNSLKNISDDVKKTFEKNPSKPLSEDAVNDRFAQAIASAITKAFADAEVIITTGQQLAVTAKIDIPPAVTGTAIVSTLKGKIT